jgi:hypothetical protein
MSILSVLMHRHGTIQSALSNVVVYYVVNSTRADSSAIDI